MKLVITMSRRFGTGASIIAKELSEQLHIPVYDKAYIEQKINDHMYESEAEAIRKLAEKPCIILGRCASDILKGPDECPEHLRMCGQGRPHPTESWIRKI